MDSARTCRTCGSALPGLLLPGEAQCAVCAVAVWREREGTYSANHYCGVDPAGTVRTHSGNPAVVFCASSSVNYYRGASRMPAARFAGSLAEAVAGMTGTTAITATSGPRDVSQASTPSGPEEAFASALAAAVSPESFVIDLRGMRDRSFAVCVGTGPLPDERTYAVADAVAATCARRGLEVAVNQPFAALPPWTVVHHAQVALGVPALQVQFSASLRDPVQQAALAQVTLTALRAAAHAALAPTPDLT